MRAYINCRIITENLILDNKVLLTKEGKILAIENTIPDDVSDIIDCKNLYLSPGFVDLHVHGGGGYSAMGKTEEIIKMCHAHALRGTTSILPTTLAAPINQLKEVIKNIENAMKLCNDSHILGVHLEGPFISPKMKGAQSEDNILTPSIENITQLLDCSKVIRIIGAAPEIENGYLVAQEAKKRNIIASIAHSDADYQIAEKALDYGYSDITHIYSACSAMKKVGIFRHAGVVEAGLSLDKFTTQFIADLRHLPYGILKLIYKAKGPDKAYAITDGLEYSALDMTEGTVIKQENGLEVIFEDNVMKLKDRSCLAGSVATSNILVKNMYHDANIPLTDAVRMASLTPLSVIGLDNIKGKIAPSYDEDIILFDENISINYVCVNGKIIRNDLLS